MSAFPKMLILDKNVFFGTSIDKLCRFVRNHFVVLPLVLLDECVTDEKDPQESLLNRFGKVLLAGAYICPSARDIVEKEGQILEPFGSLADGALTRQYREELQTGKGFSKPNTVKCIHEGHADAARTLLDSQSRLKEIVEIAGAEFEKAAEALRKSQANKSERLKCWVEMAGSMDMHELAIASFAHFTDMPDKYCLSHDWFTWHFLRLTSIITLEHEFLEKGKGGEKELTHAEHDLQDIEYVLLLCRADGLLTCDKGCKLLAQAAFPEKDVFSSLDDVPDKYLGVWH